MTSRRSIRDRRTNERTCVPKQGRGQHYDTLTGDRLRGHPQAGTAHAALNRTAPPLAAANSTHARSLEHRNPATPTVGGRELARTQPNNGGGLDGAFGVGGVASGNRRRPHVDVEESGLVHKGGCRSIDERRVQDWGLVGVGEPSPRHVVQPWQCAPCASASAVAAALRRWRACSTNLNRSPWAVGSQGSRRIREMGQGTRSAS